MLIACLKKSDTFNYRRVDWLYDRLVAQSITDNFSPSMHQKKVEQQQLLWTTYNIQHTTYNITNLLPLSAGSRSPGG